jgi:hypothetical protein
MMKITPPALAALACIASMCFISAAHAGDWVPSPSGDCIDLESMTADTGGRMYFKVYHSRKPSCGPIESAQGVAVDCSQVIAAISHDRIKFFTYSEGSRRWEPAETVPDKEFAATIVFACVVNW